MSTLSFASQSRLRKIPQTFRRASNGCLSTIFSLVVKCPRISLIARRHNSSSSASIASYFLPNFLKQSFQESVKTTILDKVTEEENRVWSSGAYSNDHTNGLYSNGRLLQNQIGGSYNPNGNNVTNGGVDGQISSWHHDSLDDLLLDSETSEYWPNLPPGVRTDTDPFQLCKSDVDDLSKSIREDLLGTAHPVLNKAASYFFGDSESGKKVRPLMVMLLSRALADTVGNVGIGNPNSSETPMNVLDDETKSLFSRPLTWQRQDLPQAQRRLAEISEMIHTASLFHDDVIDGSETRRGVSAVHVVFGNKMAILAGDYLLARASISLARLRHIEVVECMSTIIEHLVRGEVMQMRGTTSSEGNNNERMEYYLKKNYYKTGSLMANSCKSAALLAECPPELVVAAYNYGKHVGMAFQLVDDVLDFEGDVRSMGKPALADLRAGLSTAPVLFAAEEYPELEAMMDRKFKKSGDVEKSRKLILQSQGIERTKELARVHAERAMEAILPWNATKYRDALINLAYKVVKRTK